MKICELNWLQVEDYLTRDDRAVLPLGSTEQHAYLSLCVDNILAERVAVDAAAEPGVPVFPVVNYGLTPYFRAYPGSVTLRTRTYLSMVEDLLDSLAENGFRRILIVNGHGGNAPAQGFVSEWLADHPGCRVKFHNWWNAPKTLRKVQELDPHASHASWMENFPWTRLPGVALPTDQKPMIDAAHMRLLAPQALREYLQEGSFGGYFERPDEEMLALWDVAVAETRELLDSGWGEL